MSTSFIAPLPRPLRGALLIGAFLIALTVSTRAEALELVGMGGMGVNFWSMDVSMTGRTHQKIGVGVTGRVHLKLGRFARVQAGLIQGRFHEEDESRVKRNLIFGAAEGVYHVTENLYVTAGLRLGGDHIELTETLESLGGGRRMVQDADRWSFLWEPFFTIGLRLAEKYHFELETGLACALEGAQVRFSTIIKLGIFFRMGGRS
jgi:hypothetical protein